MKPNNMKPKPLVKYSNKGVAVAGSTPSRIVSSAAASAGSASSAAPSVGVTVTVYLYPQH